MVESNLGGKRGYRRTFWAIRSVAVGRKIFIVGLDFKDSSGLAETISTQKKEKQDRWSLEQFPNELSWRA